ncbi:MAG: DinB family protein [Acidobacteriota bacterium]|nr:DinB family protein [Acidobacteriota bacterium]
MSDSALIVDQLNRAFDGDAWHGPSVLELLDNLGAKTAASHPVAKAHSIWELVLHIEAWELAALRRLAGDVVELKDEEDFPPIEDSSDTAWKATLIKFKRTHDQLLTTITAMSRPHLTRQVPGKDYDFEFMFHGLAQHALYHAGQIAILKIAAAN